MFHNIEDFIGLRKQETTLALQPFNVLTDELLGMYEGVSQYQVARAFGQSYFLFYSFTEMIRHAGLSITVKI